MLKIKTDNKRALIDKENLRPGSIIRKKHIGLAILIVLSLLLAVALPISSTKLQYVILLIVPAILLCLIIFIDPFYGICMFFFYEFARPDSFIPALRPLRIVMVIEITTLISWFFYLSKQRIKPYWYKFNWSYIVFLGVIAISILTAANNRHAYDAFQVMLITFIIYFIATNVITSVKRLKVLVWLFLLIHFYFALKGILNQGLVGGSLMGDENDFALALNTFIPFAFFMFLAAKNFRNKLILLAILTSLVLGVISSMSRGGWIGLVAVMIFCIIRSKKIAFSVGISIILGAAVILFAPSKYWDEIKTISDTRESTATTRLNYWKAAGRMFMDYPLTGVGADNGPLRMQDYVTGFDDPATQWGRTFHGTLPQLAAELGLIGLISFLFMIFLSLKYMREIQKRKSDDWDSDLLVIANSIMGGLIGYLVTATFLSTLYYPQIWTLFTMSIILWNSYNKTEIDGIQAPLISAISKPDSQSVTVEGGRPGL